MKGWRVKTTDMTAAFLQGTEIERDIYLCPPKERRIPGMIWKMVKRAYGFVDTSRGLYLELRKTLETLGCKCSKSDPALYTFHVNDEIQGLILTHVDDFL